MALKDMLDQNRGVQVLQRSLERGRLAHAYLFTGHGLDTLEAVALSLAKTLSCRQPVRGGNGVAIDCCDRCVNCRKADGGNLADLHWVRPESKLRVITVDQMRSLMRDINLKPTEAEHKVAVIVAADRLNMAAANAFLKTLEEPPPKSVLILLTTEPERILETIQSRCLRLDFAGEGARPLTEAEKEWLGKFGEAAAAEQDSLFSRYRLLDVLLRQLNGLKAATEESLSARSPLRRYEDVEKELKEKWEDELTAAIEAEYRRRRADLLVVLERWLRDVWLHTLALSGQAGGRESMTGLLNFPDLESARQVAQSLSPDEAIDNLRIIGGTQQLLHTNVQEALALEVGMLKLHLGAT